MDLNLNNLEEEQVGGMWHQEIIKKKYKPVSTTKLRQLGLVDQSMSEVERIEDLRNKPPNIVIAEAARSIKFIQNYFKEQELKKRQRYVMGLGVFQQLQYAQDGKTKILKPTSLKFKSMYTPYKGQNLNGKTLLVSRTGGIGDLLFIKPNLNYLKEKYPDCKILFACGPQYQAMTETWDDCIDELLDLPFPVKYLIQSDYQAIFEGVIERCRQAHTDNAYNLFSKWLGLDLPDSLLLPKQDAKEEIIPEVQSVLDNWGLDRFVVMQLRASSPIRTPRPEFWANVMNELGSRGYDIVLTDTPRQSDNIEEFKAKYLDDNIRKKVYNFSQHSLSLDYTIALTKLSTLVVATDSALNHIAASLDVPCYGIYGPFPGYIRLKTYPKANWVDAAKHCAPCYIHGHTPCPQAGSDGYSPCYDNINIKDSVDEMEKLLK